MEFLKKKILQITTTGITESCTGTCRVIIPDLSVIYCMKINLTQNAEDIGFFDAYMIDDEFDYIDLTGPTTEIIEDNINDFKNYLSGGTTFANSGLLMEHSDGVITGSTITPTYVLVTGTSSSRVSELRKYTITNVFTDQYIGNGDLVIDGVDYNVSGPLSGSNIVTTFKFIGQGLSSPDFINKPIYKDPNKENIISNPKIYDDVFIVRQELSAFDKNYRLEYITNLADLETYAGGRFFNIENNS